MKWSMDKIQVFVKAKKCHTKIFVVKRLCRRQNLSKKSEIEKVTQGHDFFYKQVHHHMSA